MRILRDAKFVDVKGTKPKEGMRENRKVENKLRESQDPQKEKKKRTEGSDSSVQQIH